MFVCECVLGGGRRGGGEWDTNQKKKKRRERYRQRGFESVPRVRCMHYGGGRFYGAIRKIMSSHANDRRVCTVQNECPLICKALRAERAQSSPRMEIRRRWRRHSAPRRTDSIIYPLFSLSLSFSSFLPHPPPFLRYPLPPCLFPALSLWILSHLYSAARAHPRLPGDRGTSGYF